MSDKRPILTIKEIKKKMLAWEDFYGGDIMYTDLIDRAKTKKDLYNVMQMYYRHLEDMANDAQRHCERFTHSLGLNNFF